MSSPAQPNPVPSRRRSVLILLLVTATLVAAAAGLLLGHTLRRAEVPLPPRDVAAGVPTPTSVRAATSSPTAVPTTAVGSQPSAAGVAATLAGPLADARLGGRTLTDVVDVATGTSLFAAAATSDAAPASTAKLATAAAVLTVHTPTDRITTSVTAGPTPGSVVLVGAGDPTLSAAPAGTATAYAGAARISDLAAAVTATLAGAAVTTVYVDGAAFPGAATAPGWAPQDAPSEYASPITAAMVDGGRNTSAAPDRSADPAGAAGRALAAALGVPGATVTASPAGSAPGATVLGSVQSAPIGQIVDEMLLESDNVLAECLARQVAMARGLPASFDGAAQAVRQVLPDLGAGLLDGSGLSATDRLTPLALTAVLQDIATTPRLQGIVDMLPVAGWNGTLRDRYLTAPESSAAGRVRAKTGTLTGVSTLAGLVITRTGRLLAFAVLCDQVAPTYDGTLQAESALDEVAAALADLP